MPLWGNTMANNRNIYFNGGVDEGNALYTIIQLLVLDAEDKQAPIFMYINSPGGSVTHGLAIYDVLRYIDAPVVTICTGLAASMGSFLLSCGKKGARMALKHSRILIHQPLIRFNYVNSLRESDLREEAVGIDKTRQTLESILAANTGQPLEKVHEDCERNNWMSAEEALAYGLIDKVI